MDDVCQDFETQILSMQKNEERKVQVLRSKLIMVLGNFMLDFTIAKQFPDPIGGDDSLEELI